MAENYQADLEASRRRAGGWLVLGLLLAGLLLFLCTCRDSRLIQTDLWNKGRLALEANGYDPNILSISGRDATLTGTVATEAIKTDAEAVVRSVNGIRQVAVQNNLAVANVPAVAETLDTAPVPALVPQRNPSLSVAVAAGTVTLSGLVAGGSKPQILEAATQLYGAGNVVDNLEVADDVAAPNWLAGALGLLPQVKNEVQEGRLEATSEGITLSGTAASEQAKAGLGVAAQGATGLAVQNNLAVATIDLKPASFAFRLADGKADLSGTVPEATLTSAVEAASRAVGAENVVNNLQVAADVAEPSWGLGLFSALPTLVNTTPNLGINVVNNNVTLTGTVSSPETRESLARQVQDVVGAEITVTNELEVATPPQLRVNISPDAVQLSGTVSQTSADAVVQAAGTISSTGSVVNQLTVGENIAQPSWLPALLEQLPTLATDVQEAELSVQGNTITLLGAVPSNEQKTTVENNIRQAVGEEPMLVNQLRVVAPIAEVQPALSVGFAEDAATLSGNVAQVTAEQITEAFTTLPDVALSNQLTTAENVAQPEWLPNVIGLIPGYKTDVQEAKLDIKDNRVTLGGVVLSEEKKTELGTAFTEAAGEGVTVVNNLQIEAAEPVALSVTMENGVVQLAGNVPADIAESIADTVDNASDAGINNEIQAASSVAVPDWLPSIVNLLPTVTTEVKDADVTIEGNTITLGGTVETQEQKTELANSVSEAAGETVEVVNNLTVETPTPSEPVQLRVQIQDGVATLGGNVPETTATQLSEAVTSAPDAPSITDEIEAVPNVQVPTWLPDVVASLPEVTSDVEDADINIVADTITLSGVAPTEERKAEIAETVKQAAGADVNVVNNLTVVPETVAETPVADTTETSTPEPEGNAQTPQTEVSSGQEEPVTQVGESATEDVAGSAETAQTPASSTEEPATSETEQSETAQTGTSTQEETVSEPVVVVPTRNPDVRVEIAGNTLRFTGVVPSTESVTAAVAPYTKETVENLLEPNPEVANVVWLPKLYEIAPRVAGDLNRATLVLSDTTLTIQGTAPSVEMRDAIGKYVNDALQPDVTVINRLSVQLQIPFAEDGK
jgi:osmotically-inducible protein OsmY